MGHPWSAGYVSNVYATLPKPARSWRGFGEQVFVKSAERFGRVGNLDLENPQALRRLVLEIAQVAALVHRVRKIAHAMAFDGMVELPAHRRGALAGVIIKLLAAQALMAPYAGHLAVQLACGLGASKARRRMAGHEGIADVALVAVEHQAQVDEVTVVFAQAHVRLGGLAIGFGGVGADADDRRM